MKKFKDGFEGKKIYSWKQIDPGAPLKTRIEEKGTLPSCFKSALDIIEKSSVVTYEGGSEILDCKCGKHKAVITARYEFAMKTEESQLISDQDSSIIKISLYEKINKKEKKINIFSSIFLYPRL